MNELSFIPVLTPLALICGYPDIPDIRPSEVSFLKLDRKLKFKKGFKMLANSEIISESMTFIQ